MKVYVFGNQDLESDNIAFEAADLLKNDYPRIQFIKIKPNEDLPFASDETGQKVVIIDAVEGIRMVTLIEDINKFILPPRSTVHDFDLSFQLKYLKKIGRLGEVLIIGLPMQRELIDYSRIHSILRKLVAQDIQGS